MFTDMWETNSTAGRGGDPGPMGIRMGTGRLVLKRHNTVYVVPLRHLDSGAHGFWRVRVPRPQQLDRQSPFARKKKRNSTPHAHWRSRTQCQTFDVFLVCFDLCSRNTLFFVFSLVCLFGYSVCFFHFSFAFAFTFTVTINDIYTRFLDV